jgi:hypothetical protein
MLLLLFFNRNFISLFSNIIIELLSLRLNTALMI